MEIGERPEALDEQQIESMIHEHVHQKLQVILESEMADALHEFVDKARICTHFCPLLCTFDIKCLLQPMVNASCQSIDSSGVSIMSNHQICIVVGMSA